MMFDFFGKKHRQQLFDRAYAEFVSENHIESIRIATELISEDDKNYLGYNLRARCYSVIGKFDKAYHDAKKSIEFEPNININRDAYDIRNNITKSLQSSTLNIYELLDFLSTKEVLELIVNNAIHDGKKADSRIAGWLEKTDVIKKLTLVILTFLYDKSINHPNIIGEMDKYNNAGKFCDFLLTNQQNFCDESNFYATNYGGPNALMLARPITEYSLIGLEVDWSVFLGYQMDQPIYTGIHSVSVRNEKRGLYHAINDFVWGSTVELESEFTRDQFYWLCVMLNSINVSISRPYYLYSRK
jgi:hypothetical protein